MSGQLQQEIKYMEWRVTQMRKTQQQWQKKCMMYHMEIQKYETNNHQCKQLQKDNKLLNDLLSNISR